ncbi:glyoxalase I [Cytidiella melzeri]|nr:glyoxalase I [Cytidiella melzeri]
MAPPPETKGFRFNHTMIRVKDPKVSIKFYTEILGMEVIAGEQTGYTNTKVHSKLNPLPTPLLCPEHQASSFTLYFLAFDTTDGTATAEEKSKARSTREGVLELTHNHGTENDPDFAGYASGNTEPGRGFGHIAIAVPNIEEACARFESLGVPFKKRLTDGTMKHIAFILDPDGYWVEIIPRRFS